MTSKPISELAEQVIGQSAFSAFDALIDAAPEEEQPVLDDSPVSRAISSRTSIPKRYRAEWERPKDIRWTSNFERTMRRIRNGGILALIGPRGTGKTRLAAEAVRNFSPQEASYDTATGLFLRIRSSYGKSSRESESDIVAELASAPLLVLDEIQERGNTSWEDRVLTHILDRRYGAVKPTIVIANLTMQALVECLGESIISRLMETGGVLEVDGPSHRIKEGQP